MPVQQVRKDGRKGWRYGTSGQVYFGPNAKDKAKRDMTHNAFCPTGPGGGIDDSCSGKESSGPLNHKTLAAALVSLHNETREKYKAAFKKHGVAMWAMDRNNHILRDKNEKFIAEQIKTLKNGTQFYEPTRPLTQLDSWRGKVSNFEKVRKQLDKEVDKLHGEAVKQYEALAKRFKKGPTTNAKKRSPNPLRTDPTRTASLRRRFAVEMRKRFNLLKADIKQVIIEEDVFGLESINHDPLRNSFCPTGEGGGVDPSCSSTVSQPKEYPKGSKAWISKVHFAPGVKRLIDPKTVKFTESKEDLLDLSHLEKMYPSTKDMPPIVVRVSGKTGEIIDGHHRDQIAKNRGDSIPAVFIAEHESNLLSSKGYTDPTELSYGALLRAKEYHAAEGLLQSLKNDPTTKSRGEEVAKILDWRNTANASKGKFRFHSTLDKIKSFGGWLKRQIQYRILGNTVDQIERGWWTQYAEAGYKQGGARAFDDFHKRSVGKPGVGDFYHGTREQFMRDSFGKPVQVERIKVLAARTFTDLKGVTEQMSTGMSRTLTDGLTRGDNPRKVARDLIEDVDGIGIQRAELIARTEIIRAHAEGQLDALQDLGLEEVGVMVEWSTAGDGRVCPACEELEGVVLRIDEAHNKIPRHPDCRCSYIPANVGEDTDGQVRGKSLIDKAFEKSVDGDEDTTWQGADADISKYRPESILNANPNHDEQGRFSSGLPSSIDGQDFEHSWSDNQSFHGNIELGKVKDGVHVVEPFVYKVEDGQATIQKHVDAKFDYEKNVYNIVPRNLPPEKLEDRTYVHHTDSIDVKSASDLRVGKSGGRWGANEFNAVYAFQQGTHYAEGNTFGSNKHEIKLTKGTKIATTGVEIREARDKFPDLPQQDALTAAGYHGFAKLDRRGDVWELALFDPTKITTNSFCPTGPGGGVDPSCSPGQSGGLPKDSEAVDKLKFVKLLGGSTGASLVEDEHGNKFVRKEGKNAGQIRAEQAAHDAYVAAGVPMVDSKLYETDKGPVKIAKFVDGKTYDQLDDAGKAIVKAEMHKNFAVDAVMANWDVMGMHNDNVLLGNDGKVYRIDVGGSLDYRAQGGPKGSLWNEHASEMESMRTLSKNPTAKAMFGDMTPQQVYDSASSMKKNASEIVKSLPQQYKTMVADRIDNAVEYAHKANLAHSLGLPTPPMANPNPTDIMPKVIKPAEHMSPASKQFKEELSSSLHTYDTADVLHTGVGLANHLKSSGMKATSTYFKKIEVLNPNGIKHGMLIVPGQVKELKEKMIAHMKTALPAGISMKTGHLSIKKWEVGKESQLVKTSTTGAKAWTSTHHDLDYSAAVISLPLSKSATISGDQKKWLASLTHHEDMAISSWKSGNSKTIRMNIAKGEIGFKEKGILSAIEKAPKFSGVAYRGIHGEFAEKIANSIMEGGVGSIRSLPYPAGFSRNSHTALDTGGGNELFLRIRTNSGRSLEGSNGYHSEQELLIPPGSKVRVLGFTKNTTVQTYDHHGEKSGTSKVKWFVDLEHIE